MKKLYFCRDGGLPSKKEKTGPYLFNEWTRRILVPLYRYIKHESIFFSHETQDSPVHIPSTQGEETKIQNKK